VTSGTPADRLLLIPGPRFPTPGSRNQSPAARRPDAGIPVTSLSQTALHQAWTRAWQDEPVCREVLARISHHLATANRDLPQSAAFPPIGLLNILRSMPALPSSRKYHISRHLSILTTRRGETCGLGVPASGLRLPPPTLRDYALASRGTGNWRQVSGSGRGGQETGVGFYWVGGGSCDLCPATCIRSGGPAVDVQLSKVSSLYICNMRVFDRGTSHPTKSYRAEKRRVSETCCSNRLAWHGGCSLP